MGYWLDLFTGTTWREFRDAGANVSGFRARQLRTAKRMQSGITNGQVYLDCHQTSTIVMTKGMVAKTTAR